MTGFQAENRYFRVLPLSEFGITGDFEVARVQFGIPRAIGPQGLQPVAVRLHTLAGELLLANLTQIAEEILDVPEQVLNQVDVSFSNAVIPTGSTLVVEVFIPSGQQGASDFLLGFNEDGETSPGFITAQACVAEPLGINTVENVHLVMTVYGRER